MLDDINFEAIARSHANELNKSIETIATNVLIGLSLIALAVAFKR